MKFNEQVKPQIGPNKRLTYFQMNALVDDTDSELDEDSEPENDEEPEEDQLYKSLISRAVKACSIL